MKNPQGLKAGRGSDQFPLRLPGGMRERLKYCAEMNSRTMNAEIVERLDYALPSTQDDQRNSQLNIDFDKLREEIELLKEESDAATIAAFRLEFQHAKALEDLAAALREIEKLEQERMELQRFNSNAQTARQRAEAKANALREEIESLRRWREETEKSQFATIDGLMAMMRRLDESLKEDRLVLGELEEIARYLESDLVLLDAEINEPWAPRFTAVAPNTPTTFLAERIARAIDGRMLLLASRVADLTEEHGNHAPLRRAKVVAHDILTPDDGRLVAHMLVEGEEPGKITAAAFYEFVQAKIADVPDDRQGEFVAALRTIMPRLFRFWTAGDDEDQDALLAGTKPDLFVTSDEFSEKQMTTQKAGSEK